MGRDGLRHYGNQELKVFYNGKLVVPSSGAMLKIRGRGDAGGDHVWQILTERHPWYVPVLQRV